MPTTLGLSHLKNLVITPLQVDATYILPIVLRAVILISTLTLLTEVLTNSSKIVCKVAFKEVMSELCISSNNIIKHLRITSGVSLFGVGV